MSSRRSEGHAALRRAAPVFAALGDESRLTIVARLGAGARLSTARLTDGTELTRQAITKHLEVLASAGLVRDVRAGRERLWQLEARRINEARRALDGISAEWDQALTRLARLVETEP
jgi:DNA-binding transcriptional ArsR family regulator